MKNARMVVCLLIIIWTYCFCLSNAEAITQYYEDGGMHYIGFHIDNNVWVRNDTVAGNPTTVTLLSSGSISRKLVAFGSSEIIMLGGTIGDDLFSYGISEITMSGGTVNGWFESYDAGVFTMSGGSVGKLIVGSYSGSHCITIMSGGTVDTDITVSGWSSLTFKGHNFSINGNPLNYGKYTTANFASGHIMGTLENGDLLNNNLSIWDNANIILAVPEPATLYLLGIGLMMFKKNKIS